MVNFIRELIGYIKDRKWLAILLSILTLTFIGLLIFTVNNNKKIEQQVIQREQQAEEAREQEKYKLSDRTVHTLLNPSEYTNDEVESAYNESLTTFDSEFVEDNIYMHEELLNGVYLYHEKVDDTYKRIKGLAEEVNALGVPVFFYTPQNDQSVASLANHVEIVDEDGIVVYGLVVRDGNPEEEFLNTDEVIDYLGGVIDANK